jgi:DNA-binding NtrC family response regulator
MEPARPVRLLVVEDDAPLLEVLCGELLARGHSAVAAETVAGGLALLDAADFEVALLDLMLPDGSGIDILGRISARGLPVEAIVLTGQASLETAIEAMKLGAYDYVTKPARTDELDLLVRRAAEKARLRRENDALRLRLERLDGPPDLVTDDPAMRDLLAAVDRAAASDLAVLIEGEPGTGRETMARVAHDRSPRSNRPFVAVDCWAAAAEMEAELFGHEAPAGRAPRRAGLVDAADGGVLFLDEVCDLPPSLQGKLLRVLEKREFARVGGSRPVHCDVRVVSATRRDLRAAVREGRFRDDLHLRLAGVTLRVPPLRERRGDVPLLARHFLARFAPGRTLTARATDALQAYAWPGNVRELEMVVRRAAILSTRDAIDAEDLPADLREQAGPASPRPLRSLAEMEREYIESVLRANDGHRGRTARALGIDPKTLYNKLGPERPRRKA